MRFPDVESENPLRRFNETRVSQEASYPIVSHLCPNCGRSYLDPRGGGLCSDCVNDRRVRRKVLEVNQATSFGRHAVFACSHAGGIAEILGARIIGEQFQVLWSGTKTWEAVDFTTVRIDQQGY